MTTRSCEAITVTGIVQGVGFRPFVYRLATELRLDGRVRNESGRVLVELAGPPRTIDEFGSRLVTEAPPLARIDSVTRVERPTAVDDPGPGFHIVESRATAAEPTVVSPDIATCAECLHELFDPADRRFGHPFITCTNCGPRLTITRTVPYDRANTTLAGFDMCEPCRAEYTDPGDRRYHAQPIACTDCGPTLSLHAGADRGRGESIGSAEVIEQAAQRLRAGQIVAIKGLGGYHLSVDATDPAAVARLRSRKQRPDKPLAVMVADVEAASRLADLSPVQAELLASPQAPIVLVRSRTDSPLAANAAPNNPLVGIMIAYTPVHHLLARAVGRPLVMTSANHSGEPLAHTLEQIVSLAGLYDAVVDHDRPIATPCDDSVVRMVGDLALPIRRARGYAPIPVAIGSASTPPVLALGAELKNTVCIAAGGRAWISQHLGDVANLATLQAVGDTVDRMADFYRIDPVVVAADRHPGYLSTRLARERVAGGRRLELVQHHHAHVAAVMAEHQLDPTRPVVGVAYDGTGYGDDATIWGGEILLADAAESRRVAHLEPFQLPGGDAAIANPSRAALALLAHLGIDWDPGNPAVAAHTQTELDLLARQLDGGFGCAATSSMGRLFDAVAALIGIRQKVTFEAQAAIELEIAAGRFAPTDAVDPRYRLERNGTVLSPDPMVRAILDDLATDTDRGLIAARMHHAIADATVATAQSIAHDEGLDTVVLSGGVFQNARLVDLCRTDLARSGLAVFTHQLVPPNDGGLSLGQAFVASHRPVSP